VIAGDRIETVGAGIDAVTDHMIVTVVTNIRGAIVQKKQIIQELPLLI